jgi:dUTP pyrophosphatase
MMQKILIKKLHLDVNLPAYETSGSSGMDLQAYISEEIILKPGERKLIPTGLSVAIPENLEIQIRPRSGLAYKKGISVVNTPGTIDSDYRGEIKVLLINLGKEDFVIKKFERIAQMVVCPITKVVLSETNDLPDTIRGEGGFGSTGV